MLDPATLTPFRAIAYVRSDKPAFIGKDKHYKFHRHLRDSKNQPIPPKDFSFYVDFVLLTSNTLDTIELKTIRALYLKAMQSEKDPGLPTELPSYLFEDKKEGDLVNFHWRGYPIELALHQTISQGTLKHLSKIHGKQAPLRTDKNALEATEQGTNKNLNFEDVFNSLREQAELSLHQIGGFNYPEDVDYKMIRTLFENTVYTVDTIKSIKSKENEQLSFISQPLTENLWMRFQQLVDRRESKKRFKRPDETSPIGCFAGRRFPDDKIFYEKEVEGVTQRTYLLSGVWTKRDSLQILVNKSLLWLTAETEVKLPAGAIVLSPFPKYQQEVISLPEGIVPSSITTKFINDGEFLLKFDIQKSA